MGFAHVQGAVANTSSAGGSLILTLTSNPVTGDIVCVAVSANNSSNNAGVTSLTVKDSNNNSYVVTAASPSTWIVSCGQIWLAYLLSAPSNATKTLTIAWTGTANVTAWADEFSVSGGTASFGTSIPASSSSAGTTINTPSITPTQSGDLLYAGATGGGTLSAPAAGATLGGWTGAGGGVSTSGNGGDAEYILSGGTSATTVDFTQSSGTWSAMVMSFLFTATGGHPFEDDSYQPPVPWVIEQNVTIWQ